MIKKERAIEMFNNLTQQTSQDFTIQRKEFNKEISLPSFI
jgi:hypothetical protein